MSDRPTPDDFRAKVYRDREHIGDWRVEKLNDGDESYDVAIFSGADANGRHSLPSGANDTGTPMARSGSSTRRVSVISPVTPSAAGVSEWAVLAQRYSSRAWPGGVPR